MHNRRKEERINYPVRVLLNGRNGQELEALALDTSRNGALIDTGEYFQAGDRVQIQFKTSLAKVDPVEAQVVRTETAFFGSRTLIGVHFAGPSASLQDVVLLEKRLREGY